MGGDGWMVGFVFWWWCSGRFYVSVWVCLCLCVSEEEEDDESELVLQMEKREKKRAKCEINKRIGYTSTITVYICMVTVTNM